LIIIAIEGLDKSGKHTQCELLYQRLKKDGYNVAKSEFHRYDTPTGRLIRDWLSGKYKTDQYTIELIMAADKQAQQQWFAELENNGVEVLILDRYTLSEMVYAICNNIEPKWIVELQKYIRKPDLNIIIDIPAKISIIRKGKFGDNDKYEENLEMLRKVRIEYLEYGKFENNMVFNGLQTIEQLHSQIYEYVSKFLQRTMK